MQEYLQKTRLSAVMDEIGAFFALLAGSMGLYLLLWGLRPMAVLAGLSTFTLCLLLRARTREKRLRRREQRLRRRIGGELCLEAWAACPSRRAHFETARLLAQARPLNVLRVGDRGALCLLPDQGVRVLVACAQTHRAERLEARDVAAFQRACRAEGADRGCLCGAEVSAAAREQAALPPIVTLVGREPMIALAGAAHPADNSRLVALGRRFAGNQTLKTLRAAATEPQRAEKYLLYSLLLLGLYVFSGQVVYAVFGLSCALLMTLCRVRAARAREEERAFL